MLLKKRRCTVWEPLFVWHGEPVSEPPSRKLVLLVNGFG